MLPNGTPISNTAKSVFLSILLIIAIRSDQCGLAASQAQGGPGSSVTMSLKDIASQMKRSEDRLLNLRLESEVQLQRRDPNSGAGWKDAPEGLKCTAWYNGLPGSKVRLDVHKEVTQWVNGASSFAERKYTAAFDGQYGRAIHLGDGSLGQMSNPLKGELTPVSPPVLGTPFLQRATGALSFPVLLRGKREEETIGSVRPADPCGGGTRAVDQGGLGGL